MSTTLRYRSGLTHLCRMRVAADTVIHAGDLVYLDSGTVKPAASLAWNSDLATTQDDFAAVFAGVAHQSSAAGETDDISVDLSPLAVYEFDCAPAPYEAGDRLGPDELSSTLMSHQLEAVAGGTAGMARAVEYRPSGSTTVRVTLVSALHGASAGAAATS